jgi:hypothetical protein
MGKTVERLNKFWVESMLWVQAQPAPLHTGEEKTKGYRAPVCHLLNTNHNLPCHPELVSGSAFYTGK